MSEDFADEPLSPREGKSVNDVPSPAGFFASVADKLSVARTAYAQADVDASMVAHDAEIVGNSAPERHKAMGEYLKGIVYGGADGIVTTFALICGVSGTAEHSIAVILILSLANLIADAISMGVGDYVSERAELDYARAERSREEWEMDNYPEGEKSEMVELYESRGVSHEDATRLIEILSRHKDVFVDTMMVEELGIMPPEDEDPWRIGLMTFASFVFFGALPMVAYVVLFLFGADSGNPVVLYSTLAVSGVVTLAALFLLGSVASQWAAEPFWKSGLFMMINGGLAALAALAVSFLLNFLGVNTEG